MLDGRLPRMANILFFQPEVVDGWRLQRQGRRWFLGIIIDHLPKILFKNIGCLEFVFRGSQVIKSKKLLLRIIGYLEIIFHGSQVIKNSTILARSIGHLEFIFHGIQADKSYMHDAKGNHLA